MRRLAQPVWEPTVGRRHFSRRPGRGESRAERGEGNAEGAAHPSSLVPHPSPPVPPSLALPFFLSLLLPSAVCVLLLLAVGLTFAQTAGFGFVNFDDRDYVYDNRNVSDGLSGEGIRWAFAQSHVANWHPLTWISLMLDCSLYGLNPARLHLTNVLLHAATVVLLFLVLRAITGRLWPSALVAVLFAVHPLRAESVAWVTERKDVLSGLFFVLTLGAYASYARRPFSFARYAAVMVLFGLGLLSKATLVTVPCLLLLLDYWPLGRMRDKKPRSSIALPTSRSRLPLRDRRSRLPLRDRRSRRPAQPAVSILPRMRPAGFPFSPACWPKKSRCCCWRPWRAG